MKIVALFLMLLFAGLLNAQGKTSNKPESIGFAYGVIAGRSKVFLQVEEHLKNKDYKRIIKLLKSDKPTEIFISTLVCKILVQKNEITLTDRLQKKLDDNLTSQLPVIVRSGCTCNNKVTIEELFIGVYDCNFNYSLEEWLSELLAA